MLRDASQRTWAMEAPALGFRCEAPQHEGEGHLGKPKPSPLWPSVSSPRKRGPMITAGGYGSRLSLRSAGTTIALVQAKHQLAAVRNDRRRNFIVFGLLFTMRFAPHTCRPHGGLKILQGNTRAHVPLD